MTDISRCAPTIEVVLSGPVTVETLHPLQQCLRQLLGSPGTYVINAGDVTQIDAEAADLLHGFVVACAARGASVRWRAASRSLIRAVRALDMDHGLGLSIAVPM
jgi:ABC-type transporter Mla MlaB component